MNRCTECHIHFSKTSNLTAHMKRKHPDMLHVLAPHKNDKQSQSTVPCLECSKKFASLGNLRLHVKKQHPDKLEEIAPIKKKSHICPFCSENFQTLQHLVSHKKTHLAKLKCSVCPYTGYDRENLILHYRSHHFFNIENECLKFDTFEDFQTWKSKVETETYSSFVKMYGSKKATNCTTINYNCHRSGLYKKKGINIRKLKTQGTNKIGGYCPARMNTKIMEDKTCVVNFCRSHIGHKQEGRGDGDNLMLIESDDEKMALINAVTETGLETESSLEEAKKKIFLQLTEQFNDISSFEELEAVNKIIAPIKPTIDALRYQKENINLAFPSTSRTPSNKKLYLKGNFSLQKEISKENGQNC